MEKIYTNYLFSKHILVGKENSNASWCAVGLAKLFNIRIRKGKNLATIENIHLAEDLLGVGVPQPFYTGFPDSVKRLPIELQFLDRIIHYYNTYGCDNFEGNASHSIFEEKIEKKIFNEKAPIKDFVVLAEEDALIQLKRSADDLCKSTRPLSQSQIELLVCLFKDMLWCPKRIMCVDTAIELFLKTKHPHFLGFLRITDTLKVVKKLNYDINELKIPTKHRKLLKQFINHFTDPSEKDIKECFEKRKQWKGLLHHLHMYCEPLEVLYDKKNLSAYSKFQSLMDKNNVVRAANHLVKEKGTTMLLRKLNYLLSRCRTKSQIESVLEKLEGVNNNIVLIQLILSYMNYSYEKEPRSFTFTDQFTMKSHTETDEEVAKRQSMLDKQTVAMVLEKLESMLENNLKAKINNVYIEDGMSNIALPIQETTSSGGFGVLPTGSIVKIPNSKVIRLFTYWEKVNDIDLSSIGLDEKMNKVKEFSWRCFYDSNSGIVFSGDVTNGYKGGSEYIDIDVQEFKRNYPDVRYIVMCDNVYSATPFKNCTCRAGFMIRSKVSSGEIFEPKTVNTAFTIDADSTFAYLFAYDLKENKMVWLNKSSADNHIVAGESSFKAFKKYMDIAKYFNFEYLFTRLAKHLVKDVKKANLIVSDKTYKLDDGQEQIHSYDFEKIFTYLLK